MEGDNLGLRPRNLGEIFAKGFEIYKKSPALWSSIVAAAYIPFYIFRAFLSASMGYSTIQSLTMEMEKLPDARMVFANILLAALSLVIAIASSGALTKGIAEVYRGATTTLKEAYAFAISRFGRLLGATLLAGLIAGGLFFLIALVGILLNSLLKSHFFLYLFFIPAMAAAIWLLVRYVFYSEAIIIEGEGVGNSLRRSWELTQNSFWRVLGVLLLTTGVLLIATFIVGRIAASLNLNVLLASLVDAGIVILAYPIQTAIIVTLYFDIRIRQEGGTILPNLRGDDSTDD
ncbi:MAG: DUF7847 domain-containing protein [bacterium]